MPVTNVWCLINHWYQWYQHPPESFTHPATLLLHFHYSKQNWFSPESLCWNHESWSVPVFSNRKFDLQGLRGSLFNMNHEPVALSFGWWKTISQFSGLKPLPGKLSRERSKFAFKLQFYVCELLQFYCSLTKYFFIIKSMQKYTKLRSCQYFG